MTGTPFRKCVSVTDCRNVAYWRVHHVPTSYRLEGETVVAMTGSVAVWTAGPGGPLLEILGEETFRRRFVPEESLPGHMAGWLDMAPDYALWAAGQTDKEDGWPS